jgi:hypothetical protein
VLLTRDDLAELLANRSAPRLLLADPEWVREWELKWEDAEAAGEDENGD